MRDYLEALAEVFRFKELPPAFIYTAMHGVGQNPFASAFKRLMPKASGDDRTSTFRIVDEQSSPDPEFPTVAYPNPEEDGALDLAKAKADLVNSSIVLATDPDADRFAAAQKLDDGTWYQFKGDEMGTLLGYYVFARSIENKPAPSLPLMFTSAVSSQMLEAIGAQEMFEVQETLTGFKWIGSKALEAGTRALFGYEEALG